MAAEILLALFLVLSVAEKLFLLPAAFILFYLSGDRAKLRTVFWFFFVISILTAIWAPPSPVLSFSLLPLTLLLASEAKVKDPERLLKLMALASMVLILAQRLLGKVSHEGIFLFIASLLPLLSKSSSWYLLGSALFLALLAPFRIFLLGLSALAVRKRWYLMVALVLLAGVVLLRPPSLKLQKTLNLWWKVGKEALSSPLGHGAGTFTLTAHRFRLALEGSPAKAALKPEALHNDYLQLLYELGLAGALLIFWLIAASLSQVENPHRRLSKLMLLTGFIFVSSGFHPLVWSPLAFLGEKREGEGRGRPLSLLLFIIAIFLVVEIPCSLLAEKHPSLTLKLNPTCEKAIIKKAEQEKGESFESLATKIWLLKRAERFSLSSQPFLMEASLWEQFALRYGYEPSLTEEVEEAYRAAEERDPENVFLLEKHALFCLRIGRKEEAVQLLARAVEIEPLFLRAHFLLYKLTGRKNHLKVVLKNQPLASLWKDEPYVYSLLFLPPSWLRSLTGPERR